MTSTKIVVDCTTGEEHEVPLTPDEQAEHDARVPEPMPDPASSPDGRLATLEAQHTALLDALANATALAAVRKAATDATATRPRELGLGRE